MADDPPPDPPNVTRLPRTRPPRPPPIEAQPVDTRAERARQMLGPDCPYEPLGYDDAYYYVLDVTLRVRRLGERDLARNMLVSISTLPWLEARYPRKRKKKGGQDLEPYGIAAENA